MSGLARPDGTAETATCRGLERYRARHPPDHLADHHPGRQRTRAAAGCPRRRDRRRCQVQGRRGPGRTGSPRRTPSQPRPPGTAITCYRARPGPAGATQIDHCPRPPHRRNRGRRHARVGGRPTNEFGTPQVRDRRSAGDLEFVANVEDPQGHPRGADHGVVFGPGMDVAGQRDHIVLGG